MGGEVPRVPIRPRRGCPDSLVPLRHWIVRRTMRVVRPGLLVVVEAELRPHLLCESLAQGMRIAFVTARLSSVNAS